MWNDTKFSVALAGICSECTDMYHNPHLFWGGITPCASLWEWWWLTARSWVPSRLESGITLGHILFSVQPTSNDWWMQKHKSLALRSKIIPMYLFLKTGKANHTFQKLEWHFWRISCEILDNLFWKAVRSSFGYVLTLRHLWDNQGERLRSYKEK